MSDPLSNKERKKNVGDAIKAERARIQASIDACNAKRAKNKRKSQDLAERQEELQEERLAPIQLKQKIELTPLRRLNKRICFIYVKINGRFVIVSIVDPKLRGSYCPDVKKYLIVGSELYRELNLKTFCGKTGGLSENINIGSYTVSTVDGITFEVVDDKGNSVLVFKSVNPVESLAGQSFSNVVFEQFCYDPRQVNSDSDENTKLFHSILKTIVEQDKKRAEMDPTHIPLVLKQ